MKNISNISWQQKFWQIKKVSMSDVSTNAAENTNRCLYHILLTIRSAETRLIAKSRHKIAVQDCVAQKYTF